MILCITIDSFQNYHIPKARNLNAKDFYLIWFDNILVWIYCKSKTGKYIIFRVYLDSGAKAWMNGWMNKFHSKTIIIQSNKIIIKHLWPFILCWTKFSTEIQCEWIYMLDGCNVWNLFLFIICFLAQKSNIAEKYCRE